jgi:hypothetical protein
VNQLKIPHIFNILIPCSWSLLVFDDKTSIRTPYQGSNTLSEPDEVTFCGLSKLLVSEGMSE